MKSKIPPANERKKLVPLASMFFFILFNYTILRDTKDVLMVTAKKSGAEVIPFIKTYVNLPVSWQHRCMCVNVCVCLCMYVCMNGIDRTVCTLCTWLMCICTVVTYCCTVWTAIHIVHIALSLGSVSFLLGLEYCIDCNCTTLSEI